ncbi:MAG TPA: PLP-dependent aminotransferase family protein, partial [Spirochaetia bacterium]|nr:PLP-dependent aminotransferase family protein [Spirochaetia bacterium]
MIRELNIAVSPGKGPAYLKVAHALREALHRKILRPGEALPSSRRLAEMTGLHRQTVMAALEELIAEGWIVSDLRKCYRVSGTLPTEFFEATAGSESTSVGKEFEWKLPPRLPEVLSPPSGVLRHSFQSGLSDVRLFPRREFKSCWQDSFLRSGTDVLGARNGAGQPFFLETLDLYLRRVRRLSGRHIIATHGSQEGIYIAARLLLKKDDRVAIEALGYPSAWGVFQSVGAALEPIPLDTAGLDVEALEKKLKSPSGRRIRLIYTTPLHQYPTTATMPMDRRLRLYGLAVRYGVPILEDDYDHELHYR